MGHSLILVVSLLVMNKAWPKIATSISVDGNIAHESVPCFDIAFVVLGVVLVDGALLGMAELVPGLGRIGTGLLVVAALACLSLVLVMRRRHAGMGSGHSPH